MTKICTTIEQSQILNELGLDVNTADMYYDVNSYGIQGKPEVAVGKVWSKDIPAWSLSALLNLMPKLYDEDDLNDGGCQPNLCKGWDNNLWHCLYRADMMYCTKWYDEPIDAVFEMICWLLKNKKI